MNEQLKKLYSSKWKELCTEMKSIQENDEKVIKPTNPLLLYVDKEDEFKNADLRVMIFGQETNNWYGAYNGDLDKTILFYQEFYNSGYALNKYHKQFFNGYKKICKMLEEKYPNKKIRFIWNNIVKIGKCKDKGFPHTIYETERTHFSVIKQEVQIINPEIILFLTGRLYDRIIEYNFGPLNYKPFVACHQSWLAKVESIGTSLSFRTYHPNFLYRHNIDSFFEPIINEIKL